MLNLPAQHRGIARHRPQHTPVDPHCIHSAQVTRSDRGDCVCPGGEGAEP